MPAHRVDIELHQNNLNLAAQDMVCKEARDVLQIFLNTEQILISVLGVGKFSGVDNFTANFIAKMLLF